MRSRSLLWFYLGSFLLHLSLGGGVAFYSTLINQSQIENKEIIIDLVDTNPTEIEKKKISDLNQKEKRQLIQQSENSINESEPEHSKFLSLKNQTVTKETVAQQYGQFQNIKSKPVLSNNKQSPDSKTQNLKQNKENKNTYTDQKIANLDKNQLLNLQKDLFGSLDVQKLSEIQKQNAMPKKLNPSTNSGGTVSQTNDYIKDIDKGIETVLNAKEFKYYTYYDRIRKQLSQYWEPKVREKVHNLLKKGRNIASSQDRITKLLITLNKKGTLVKVQVLSDSGIDDLDDAAIEAFKAAAPFPNPPNGIVENDGTVKIRWDFVLEI